MLLMQSTIPCAPSTGICSHTAQSLRISSRTQTDDVEVVPARPHRTPKAGNLESSSRSHVLAPATISNLATRACRSGRWASQGANRRNAAEICRSNKRKGIRRSTHHDMRTNPAWLGRGAVGLSPGTMYRLVLLGLQQPYLSGISGRSRTSARRMFKSSASSSSRSRCFKSS